MKEYFIICETDKTPYVVETDRGETDFLDFIHSHIDGFFEVVSPQNPEIKSRMGGMLILCDDEGLLKELPINLVGSYLYGNTIVGNIIIGRHGYYKGTPDIVGYDSEEDANRHCIAMATIRNVLQTSWDDSQQKKVKGV